MNYPFRCLMVFAAIAAFSARVLAAEPIAWFQAHRGSTDEAPENTLPAFEHAWKVPGAVPETDLRTTKDGVVVLMHDATAKRTTDAPAPECDENIAKLDFDTVKKWDAGIKFGEKFKGTRVPTLDDAFVALRKDPARQMYFHILDVDIEKLKARIVAEGMQKRIIFVHGSPAECLKLSKLYDGARTMTWLSGPLEAAKRRFDALAHEKFAGIAQIQFHLNVANKALPITYALDDAYLKAARDKTRAAGVDLQVRPMAFDAQSLRHLLDLGIRWYVTDSPAAFGDALRAASALPKK